MAEPNSLERHISKGLDLAFDQLVEIEKKNRPRIPEALFKNVFLGLFANLENQHPDATIENWIAIAGNPFNPVDVIDNQQVLFTVPAVFSKDAVVPQAMNENNEPIAHIVSIAEKLSLRSPIEGQNYIDNKYSGVSERVKGKVSQVAFAKEWNAIFTRYGLPPILEIDNSSTQKLDPKLNDIRDELRGDDLDFTPI